MTITNATIVQPWKLQCVNCRHYCAETESGDRHVCSKNNPAGFYAWLKNPHGNCRDYEEEAP